MTAASPALALCGSNLCGDVPFSGALRTAAGVFVARSPHGQRGDLAMLADGLCRAHGVAPAALRELRLDLGPGSYTGLRVAVTFARFLQHFGGATVLACDSLLLLASAAAPAPAPQRLRPLLDARRGHLHCGTLRHDGAGLRHLVPPRAAPWHEVIGDLAAGDLVIAPRELAARLGTTAGDRGAAVVVPAALDASALFAPRLPLRPCAPDELEPRYLMGSYAEG
ncbi:MAG: hypothetical protein FJ265_19955 [Planctomycetes bacterium]|nr:hypothetical protein [Planctomycetota bacterium]